MPELFADTVLRTAAAFLALFAAVKIIGQKEVAQLTLFDYMSGIAMGSIAATTFFSPHHVLTGLMALAAWTLLGLITRTLTQRSLPARKLIESEPILVIHKGKILEDNLARRSYNVHHLLSQLRINGVFDPNEVEAGIIEPNGELSILKRPELRPVTPRDLGLAVASPPAAAFAGRELIADGQVLASNLAAVGKSYSWLKNQLQSRGISRIEDVTLAIICPDGSLYVDTVQDDKHSPPSNAGKL